MKNLEKMEKALGKDTVNEMEAMDEASLKRVIVEANQAMRQVAEELENNQKYQELKSSMKAITAGKRDVNKRQRTRIAFSLQLLSDQGKEPEVDITERS